MKKSKSYATAKLQELKKMLRVRMIADRAANLFENVPDPRQKLCKKNLETHLCYKFVQLNLCICVVTRIR